MLPGYLPADLRRQPFIRQPGIEIRPFQHTELTAVIKVPDPFEEHAFEELVDFYQTSLLRMCYLNLHDLGLAEDAVQETFVKAYRAMPSFRGDSDVKTWLMRIAINTCRDMQRGTWQKHPNQRVSFDQLPESSIAFPEDTFPLRISAPNNQKDLHRIRAWYHYDIKCWYHCDTTSREFSSFTAWYRLSASSVLPDRTVL